MAKANARSRKSKNVSSLYEYRKQLPFMFKGRVLPDQRKSHWFTHRWHVEPTGSYEADYKTGQEYAMTFWRVVGGRPQFGSDLSQIAIEMIQRQAVYGVGKKGRGMSGIEIGFLRTIGDLFDIAATIPLFIRAYVNDPKGFEKKKFKISKKACKEVRRNTNQFVDILASGKYERHAKLEAELKADLAKAA
jgi:hypothetical protein